MFVDELDRCRPTYAIEVLECIKHLFSVEGLLFVLAVDDSQLRNAVASVYGPKIEGGEYLRKFIDWQFTLPEPTERNFARYLADRFDLAGSGRFSDDTSKREFNNLDPLVAAFGLFAEGFHLSLRQQEQCFTQINLAVRSLGEDQLPLSEVLGCFSVLRMVQPGIYRGCCIGGENAEVLIKEFEPYLKNLDFSGSFETWDKFKSIFHSWFLSGKLAVEMDRENVSLQPRIKKFERENKIGDEHEKLRERHDYIRSVINDYGSYSWILIKGNESLASLTYRRLEAAASYVSV